MARRKAEFVPGGYYHVYNRGAERQPIFRSDENYLFLLRRIKEQHSEWQMAVLAYCLMPNHYHLVLRQDSERAVSGFVQAIFNSYTKAYNRMYERSGTLFEGPFRAIAVTKEDYLLHLCRYVHRNPLEAGLVTDLRSWPYSNYLEWVRQRAGALVDREFVRSRFAEPQEYERFVLDYLPPKWLQRALEPMLFD